MCPEAETLGLISNAICVHAWPYAMALSKLIN